MHSRGVLIAALGLVVGLGGAPALAGSTSKARKKAVKMTVREVASHRGTPVVILQTADRSRQLRIYIGLREARAIQRRLKKVQPVRPMTHDLLEKTLKRLGARVVRVEVDALRDNIFLGQLTLRDAAGKRYEMDGRPSDLITLAVGAGLPVFVARPVLKKVGVPARPRPRRPATPPKGEHKI